LFSLSLTLAEWFGSGAQRPHDLSWRQNSTQEKEERGTPGEATIRRAWRAWAIHPCESVTPAVALLKAAISSAKNLVEIRWDEKYRPPFLGRKDMHRTSFLN